VTKLRVLQVHTPYREPGGEDRVVDDEAELLRGAGHDVLTHAVPNPTGLLASTSLLLRSPWNAAALAAVERDIRRYSPDVAHVHNTWFAQSPSVIEGFRRARVPVVMTLHNYRIACISGNLFRDGRVCEDCIGGSALSGVRHRCCSDSALVSVVAAGGIEVHRRRRTWQDDVDLFLCLTEQSRDLFVAAGLPPQRLAIVPNFTTDPGVRSLPPSQARDVVFVGRLVPEKGLSVLLQAWRIARPEGLRLVVIGDGPDDGEISAAVADPSGGVIHTKRLTKDEVQAWLLRSRALVFPSVWREPFGLALIEAMAAGLPVLASDMPGATSILGDGSNALLHPPGDAVSLARNLSQLSDDALVDELAARSRRRYLEAFVPAVHLEELLGAYDRARARARATPR
jgi:glycosyltransferase involved in cell wall biosynthesis